MKEGIYKSFTTECHYNSNCLFYAFCTKERIEADGGMDATEVGDMMSRR
jgi:hypothetical protein